MCALTTGALLAATGCGAPARDNAEQRGARQEVFDPPTEFDASAGVELDMGDGAGTELPETDGDTVYFSDSDGLHAVDALRGRDLWSAEPDHPVEGMRLDGAVLTEIGGRSVVIAAFQTSNPGDGAAVPQKRLEVLAVDARNGRELWSVEHIPQGPAPDARDVFALGADGDAVVVSYGTVFAFSPEDGSLLWSDPGVRPSVFKDGAVVGWNCEGPEGGAENTAGSLTALSPGDGSPMWELWEGGTADDSRPVYAAPMGTDQVLIAREGAGGGGASVPGAQDSESGASPPGEGGGAVPEDTVEWAVVDTAEGSVAYWPDRLKEQLCRYDDQSLLVCWSDGRSSPAVEVYTAGTGDRLWRSDAIGDGVATAVRGVWHGVLYTDKGLDGADPGIFSLDFSDDLGLDPGIAPDATNGVIGLRRDDDGSVSAYPAIA